MWKPIPGYTNYEVSDIGKVRSLDRTEPYMWKGGVYDRSYKGRTIKPTLNKETGYWMVHLGRDFIRPIHQLVAWAFIGPQEKGMMVLHRNGNKDDNSVGNLRYGTGRQNREDAIEHGTAAVGGRHYNSVLTEEIVLKIRRLAATGISVRKIAKELGVKYGTALAVKNRKTWGWLNEDKECQTA